jgi:ABC-2 type transport system permease protein
MVATMTNLWTVFKYELRQKLRSKSYLLVTFGIPLLAIVIFFGYRAYQDSRDSHDDPVQPFTEVNETPVVIGYVDQTAEGFFSAPDTYPPAECQPTPDETAALVASDGAPDIRRELIKRISSPYCMRSSIRHFDTFEAGERALKEGDIETLYVVEGDYPDTGDLSVYSQNFSIETASNADVFKEYLVRSLLVSVEPDSYEALYLRLRDPANVTEHRIGDTGETAQGNDDQDFVLVYGFGLSMMLALFWGGGYLMQSVVQEKESRIIEVILSSVRPVPLLAGKVLAMGVIALIQVTAIVGTFAFLITRANTIVDSLGEVEIVPERMAIMGLYFVLGFLLFGSLMAAIGALVNNTRESQNYVTFVTLPAMLPFFFLTIFIEEPNSTLAVVFSLIPLTAPLSMIMRVAVTDVPLPQIVASVALLLVGVIFAVWLAGRLFRVNTLLTGTTPKLRDIPRLLLRG